MRNGLRQDVRVRTAPVATPTMATHVQSRAAEVSNAISRPSEAPGEPVRIADEVPVRDDALCRAA
jgi:hypothetical protein